MMDSSQRLHDQHEAAIAGRGVDASQRVARTDTTCSLLRVPLLHLQQLIQSGERERLKALLREKLTECGWRDDIKQRCRGERQLLWLVATMF